MDIVFENRNLQRLCEDERRMLRELGRAGAKKLKARLADLEAAQVVTDVKRGRPHPLKGESRGRLALDLDGGCRLVIEPVQAPPPETPDGAVDWSSVQDVRVVMIGDYHG